MSKKRRNGNEASGVIPQNKKGATEMSPSPSNVKVMTVLGPISADELGVTLVHEHMAFGFPGWSADESVAPYDPKAIEAKCLNILRDIKAVGVKSVIDATPCETDRKRLLSNTQRRGSGSMFYVPDLSIQG
jgi:hypothetical protein